MVNRFSIFLIFSGLLLGSCCNKDFIMPEAGIVPDYDFFEYALDVTARIDNDCSGPEYTTIGATADGENNCFYMQPPLQNRWFKFQAISNYIDVDVRIGDDEGTQNFVLLTLWDTDGV
ncbi:MAG TPA: hypothetical protein VFM90_01840, partial [Cyclobacteriaceae bacterium]|nr:hypothetical protein [Cyclobacteriaceae bacterium]